MTGFFDSSPLEKQLANLECNATAAVQITHHFLQRLIKDRKRGCIVYTSSVSGYMPSPFSCEYFTVSPPPCDALTYWDVCCSYVWGDQGIPLAVRCLSGCRGQEPRSVQRVQTSL